MKRHPLAWFGGILGVLVVAGVLLVLPAFSYVPLLTRSSGTPQKDRWDLTAFPVTFAINPQTNSNIQGSVPVANVIVASFATWQAAPNSALTVSRASDTSQTTKGFDGVNLVCFVCTGDFTQDSNTLAVTITTTSDIPGEDNKHGGTSKFAGQIMDGDILFNPAVTFTTGGTSGQDLQTIATHEIGHFFGLDHSPVVRSVMFPFAPDRLTTLSYDDVAGISTTYPGTSTVPTGTISGTVKLVSGTGVFGAHVYADSNTNATPFGSNIRKSPIGTLTLPDGTYTISGIPVDQYIIRAEPLDLPESNDDVSGYSTAFGRSSVQTTFNTRWH